MGSVCDDPEARLFGSDAQAAEVNKRIVCKRGCVDPTLAGGGDGQHGPHALSHDVFA